MGRRAKAVQVCTGPWAAGKRESVAEGGLSQSGDGRPRAAGLAFGRRRGSRDQGRVRLQVRGPASPFKYSNNERKLGHRFETGPELYSTVDPEDGTDRP